MLIQNVPKALNKCVTSLEKLKGDNGHFMFQFAKHYNHNGVVFQGDQEAAVLVQVYKQLDEEYEDLDVLEDEQREFCESDLDD